MILKATQYTTMTDNIMKKNELMSSKLEMGGVMIIKTAQNPLPDEFEGFGTAITGASCYELNLMPKTQRDEFLKDIYTQDGLDLSVGRVTIGSSDYSAELYSYDDVKDDEDLQHFSIEKDMAYVVPMIKEVINVKPDLMLFASPWSPPGWMKTSGLMCGGYMREKYLKCYANYTLKFLKEYEKQGIHITALTVQNEPETQQSGYMPACIWHPDLEAKYILELRKLLDENKMDTKIWMYDHNFNGWRRVLWCLKEYPGLMEASGNVAFHYYEGCAEMGLKLKKEFPNLKLHFTEGGSGLYNNYTTDWCRWARVLLKTMTNGCVTLTGWNLVLDETGRPNIGPFSCGGLVTYDSRTNEIVRSGQYHAMKHFSKFIKKGAKIYPANVEFLSSAQNVKKNIECCLAENKDGSAVLEIVNPNDSKVQLQYFYKNEWWYIESFDNSVTTVVFK